MRQANASLAFIVLVRFYEATDQLRARSPWSDAQSKPSTPKEHGASCLSPQGTDRMNIQTTHSSNRRHSSKLVGTFNLFIPCCRQGRAPKADFKLLFLFCSRSNWIRTSENLLIPNQALYQAELHSGGAPLPRGAFDGKISQRGLTLPTSTIVPFPTYYGQSRNNAPSRGA